MCNGELRLVGVSQTSCPWQEGLDPRLCAHPAAIPFKLRGLEMTIEEKNVLILEKLPLNTESTDRAEQVVLGLQHNADWGLASRDV